MSCVGSLDIRCLVFAALTSHVLCVFVALQIRKHCLSAVNSQDLDDHGQVEECLKQKMVQGIITSDICVKVRATLSLRGGGHMS